MTMHKRWNRFYDLLLSHSVKKRGERMILVIAIISFVIHLLLIGLADAGLIHVPKSGGLLKNPIAAIYTPFSFILVYEVYLLLYYLPKSISTYISKQYEIITLIIIRRLFKDLSNLSLSSDWFKIKYDLQFTYDLIAAVVLFFLIYQFYKQGNINYRSGANDQPSSAGVTKFITFKKVLAASLVPVLIFVALYSFINWCMGIVYPQEPKGISFENINNIFFEQFFTILIIADVILLLVSFFYTDQFHKVIRNSGFVISTILIRLSFSVSGLLNTLLILGAITFGLLMLIIHNKFETDITTDPAAKNAHHN